MRYPKKAPSKKQHTIADIVSAILSVADTLLVIFILVMAYFFLGDYFASILVVFSLLFISLYPLIGYIFLFLYAVCLALYRLPISTIVFYRKFILEYSGVWQASIAFSFLAFLFLGIWAWNFIKTREFLRTYVVFLATSVFLACLGSFIVTILIFGIIERDNFNLMASGAKSEQLILAERSNSAMFVARTLASDPSITQALAENDHSKASNYAKQYLYNSGVDFLHIYNALGGVVASPSDTRDEGNSAADDKLVAFALKEKKQIKSFDVSAGVLSPVVVTRAVVPILVGDKLLGAVEARYVFDNAFVDFSKAQTGLDITVFTGNTRSATTIWTQDNVSRWTGSVLEEQDINQSVYEEGKSIQSLVDWLGVSYYSAFEPIRNESNKIIGIVSVGTPSDILQENTRQQLLTTFIVLTILSVIAAYIGYFMIHRLYHQKISA